MGKSLSKVPASVGEPAWDRPHEVSKFLRNNGFPEVPIRWCELDLQAKNLDEPSEDGLAIAASGVDEAVGEERVALVRRRVAFAHKFGKRKPSIKADRNYSEPKYIESATQLGLAPKWFLTGSTFVHTTSEIVDGIEHTTPEHSEPDFIQHYMHLKVAAGYASDLAHWFGEGKGVSGDEPKADPSLIVRDACLAVVNYKRGVRNKCSYKLDNEGEMSLKEYEERVRYFPFIGRILPLLADREDEFFNRQKYDLQINGEERTALSYGIGLLGQYLGIFGTIPLYSFDRRKGDPAYKKRIQDLHAKLLNLMGSEKKSPFQKTAKKGSGRRRSK